MVDIYWASLNPTWILSEEPVSVWKEYTKSDIHQKSDGVSECPSFTGHMKNYFGIRSDWAFDFSFDTATNEVRASNINDYERAMFLRNPDTNLWSFKNNFIFFTDAPSLNVHFNLPPWLEDNVFSNNTKPLAGSMDIGKWFRPTEYAFYLKGSEMKIKYGDIQQYIYVETDENINWIKFAPDERITFWINSFSQEQKGIRRKKLPWFYNHISNKLKKKVLADIHNAVV